MSQNRKPPAYQEYAATMLASRDFRLMSLPERGLLHTIRLECWENKQVPSMSSDLAKYLGYEAYLIEDALSDKVRSFLLEEDGSFTCPELDAYRKHLEDRAQKQSRGGKRGADITNSQKRKNIKERSQTVPPDVQGARQGDDDSLVKSNSFKPSKAVPSVVTNIPNYEGLKSTSEYDKASNGG